MLTIKEKRKISSDKFRRTKKGLLSTIYYTQVSKSKKRNHPKPTYTLNELKQAVMPMELFDTLFNAWVDSNYSKDLRPSLDRIKDELPYTEDNIQLMTWKENNNKGYADRKSGKNTAVNKKVYQYTLNNEYVATYHSIQEADRATGIASSSIGECCRNARNRVKAGNFKWYYKKQESTYDQ